MPLYKRQPFIPRKPPTDLKPDEDVFYLKLTNEIFRDYDDYFERMILCNSLVWSCSLTGKANLTFQEALDSEKAAKKAVKGFPRDLKKALFHLVTLTERAKVLDVFEDVYCYARDRYFKNEEVLGVIGNLWCSSRVSKVIYPTREEIENYKKEQIEKGDYEKNDYLKDESWGPPPDLFRYEVKETDPDDPESNIHILEAIDVKRDKTILTRDKCRTLFRLSTVYSEKDRCWRLKEEIAKAFNLHQIRFEDVFTGPPPKFESTLGPAPRLVPEVSKTERKSATKSKTANEDGKRKSSGGGEPKSKKEGGKSAAKDGKKNGTGEPKKKRSKSEEPSKKGKAPGAPDRKSGPAGVSATTSTTPGKKRGPKPKIEKEKEKEPPKLTPQELKQIELERRAKERENLKQQKKLIADFKKLWFKPKEDLEVEDLKDLPPPDPVSYQIPNHLFGDFVGVLEYFNCYANVLKVRDCFSSGLNFDALERALVKNEIAGPLSDILQLLLRTIFRLQETEHSEINQEQTAAVELDVDEIAGDDSLKEAVSQATTAATWSTMYQNTPLHKLNLDHLSLTEVLRLHLLASGARPSEKDVKWRWQNRGCFDCQDDPVLRLRLEEPQIIKTLTHGSVFDLTMAEKLKLITCLMNQVLTFYDVRELMEDSFEEFKRAKVALRTLQAAEKRKENEEHIWKMRLKVDKCIPELNVLKAAVAEKDKETTTPAAVAPPPTVPDKPLLTDEQIEALIEKKDKEIAKRKQEINWKEAELLDTINKHERKLGIHPIGRDRAYRRYWIFNTVPGIFVENDDDFVGTCLASPTPYLSNVNLNDVNFVKENYEKLMQVDKEGSDKENSTLTSPKKTPKKKQQSAKSNNVQSQAPRPEVFGICSGDPKTCQVHCKYAPRQKWSFYWSPDQLGALIEGLSPRGIREKELKQFLIDEKDGLINLLKRCPVTKLNHDNEYPEYMLSIAERKMQRTGQSSKHLDPNLNYPEGTGVDNIMELQLRDLILEMEDKVYLGTLGSLKVNDRVAWRKVIEDGRYEMQVDDLYWGKNKSLSKEDANKEAKRRNSTGVDSSRSSNSGSSSVSESRGPHESSPTNPVIKDLACAILQFRQGMEPKFFKRPLGIGKDDDKGKNKGKAAGTESKATDLMKGTSLSPLERWELSLMASTSFSQLFMHLFTLDNSIEWSRSVLNARCRICRRKGDPDNMLLCDECNKGHHAYCLKPPLQVIPKGDWFCNECRPPPPPPKINRPRRNQALSQESILDELDNSENEMDSYDEDEDDDDDDDGGRGSSSRRKKGKATPLELNGEEGDVEVCAVCDFGGKVICCDKCPKVYHLSCLDPPKTRVPRGDWFCPDCSSSTSKGSHKTKKGKSKSKKKKSSRKNFISSDEEESDVEDSKSDEGDVTGDEDKETLEEGDEDMRSGSENDQNGDVDKGGSDEDSDDKPKMKVKIGHHTSPLKQQKNYGTRASRNRSYRMDSDEVDEDSDDEEKMGRGRKRKSASQAAVRIAQVAKRLRSDSKENESSENSNDSNSNSRKRSYDSDSNGGAGADCPKRTRLQRMNTNQCTENGELDNVLMDRLLTEVMKHGDAWPFLKPVTRVEAPDYHEIVKYPMDLGTIKYKLNSMVYTCNEEFISDLMLIFTNCLLYNEASHPVSKAGESLRNFCERRCSKLGIHFSVPTSSSSSSANN